MSEYLEEKMNEYLEEIPSILQKEYKIPVNTLKYNIPTNMICYDC